MNNLGRGPLGETAYQNIKGLGLLDSDKKFFFSFSQYEFIKQVTPGAGPFLSQAII